MTENSAEIKSIVGGLSSVIYQANGSSYRFNLTKMAKPFGKSVADWRKLKITQEYLTALQYIIDRYEDIHNVEPLLFTKQGGNVSNLEQGTWTSDWHVALNFARWLSPEFGIWCDEIIGCIIFNKLPSVGNDIKIIDGKTYISRDVYCKSTETTCHSFAGLKGNYASEFAVVDGVYYMTTDLANAQKQQIAATKVKSNIRQKAVAASDGSVQLAIEFKD
ncbi:MAG: KilA-N domain-containing protein [Bacteroidales bacterium]|nr:KilA-N domain-containing protein [Bacteroidales bacterium]